MDADIELNGWDGGSGSLTSPTHGWYFTCSDPAVGNDECDNYGEPDCHYMDLQNTTTHEAGHFIGLSHPCNGVGEPWLPACNASHQQTTMYPATSPGQIEQRSLSSDDVNGVCTIYPLGRDTPGVVAPLPDDDDGCGCASTGPASLAPFLVAALALRRRPLRRR
jgi:MYXO-CTERM domain-containing protein